MATLPYRPAIDGLRAIAVIGVVLYHLDAGLLPGGFVGVDVFFVISGFLLTRVIYQAHAQGRFSFGAFYQRRVARLFPVLFLVTAFILVTARFVFLPQDLASTGMLALASILSVANVKLALMGSYFDVNADAVPFLHFWSLSLEEQFYVFLPVTIAILIRFRASVRTSAVWLGLIAAGSFAVSLLLTAAAPRLAFYLLQTRAWELLAGSLLALVYVGSARRALPGLVRVAKPVGVVLILLSFALIDGTDPFPGWIALVPVVGTLALLVEPGATEDRVERALASRPLVWIGKLSYSIYLWHWPIDCFVDYGMYEAGAGLRTAIKLGATAVASVASYALVERPARTWINRQQSRPAVFTVAVVSMATVAAAGYAVRQHFYLDASPRVIAAGGIRINDDGAGPRVALVGDSKASMYGLTLRTLADRLDARVQILSSAEGNPFVGSVQHANTIAALKATRPDVVVFGGSWSMKAVRDPQRFAATVDTLLRYTGRIVLLTEPPYLPEEGSRAAIRDRGVVVLREDPALTALRVRANGILRAVASSSVVVIDVDPQFVRPDSTVAFTDAAGRQLYHDRRHLSPFGADLAIDQIADAIQSAGRSSRR